LIELGRKIQEEVNFILKTVVMILMILFFVGAQGLDASGKTKDDKLKKKSKI